MPLLTPLTLAPRLSAPLHPPWPFLTLQAVMKECPKTCGVCSVHCQDHDPGCKGWANAKLCDSEEDKASALAPLTPSL